MSAPAGSHPKRPESVLVVVYTSCAQVLMLERHVPPGWWQSVTGSLEPGEQPWEAAARELVEETGLAPHGLLDLGMREWFTIAPAWRARFAPGVTENLEHAFALQLREPVDVVVDSAEHLRFAWLPLDEARERATSRSNRAAIERVSRLLIGR
jgi:dihydroneopterin triphosphate diphosphatase